MRRIFPIVVSAFVLAGCGNASSGGKFVVDCSFEQPYTGTIYLRHYWDHEILIDSSVVNHQTTVTLKPSLAVTDSYQLYTKPYAGSCHFVGQKGARYQVHFNLVSQEAELVAHTSSEQTFLEETSVLLEPFHQASSELSAEYIEAMKAKDDQRLAQINARLMKNMSEQQETVVDRIKKQPKTYAAVHLTENLFFERYPDYVAVQALLDTVRYAGTAAYQSFHKKVAEQKELWIEGEMAPDFTTKDIHGKSLSLRDFRGKYVLLDFWASWCKPCRMKAKELKALYPSLQEKGIVVLGVSLDEKRSDWLKATEEDQIIWNNTCESKRFDVNEIAQSYRIRQIPTLFLIDPDGKIIRQNPDSEYIQSLL